MSNQITVTVTIPESFTVDNLGAELGRSFNADQLGALLANPEVLFNAAMNGISNKLKDSHAGITYKSFKTEAECLLAKKAKIESTFAALMAGEWRAAREAAAGVSQETNVGRKLLLARLKPDQRKAVAAMENDARAKHIDALVAKYIKPDAIAAEMVRLDNEAKAKKAMLASLPDIELDL
jgi:K+-sensing histidine kinase KdpD